MARKCVKCLEDGVSPPKDAQRDYRGGPKLYCAGHGAVTRDSCSFPDCKSKTKFKEFGVCASCRRKQLMYQLAMDDDRAQVEKASRWKKTSEADKDHCGCLQPDGTWCQKPNKREGKCQDCSLNRKAYCQVRELLAAADASSESSAEFSSSAESSDSDESWIDKKEDLAPNLILGEEGMRRLRANWRDALHPQVKSEVLKQWMQDIPRPRTDEFGQ